MHRLDEKECFCLSEKTCFIKISEIKCRSNFYIAIYDKQADIITFPYYVDLVDGDLPEIKCASRSSSLTSEVIQTGKPVFTLAVGLSLMIFYAFAMQCMSTLAVTYRETKGWKWPLLQTLYMSALAYVSALVVYTIFS